MEGAPSDPSHELIAADRRMDQCYRLFNRQRSLHQIIGGGRAADVLLWRCRWVSIAVVSAATIAWLLFERSGLSFLTICSDVLLILIVIQFVWAKSAVLLDKPLQPLPELVLTEEMVNDAAVSFRVKFNNLLMMAHDITLGKDFRIFFQVVGMLWILSIVGSFFSFFTLAYIGIILSFTIPVLYNKYEVHVDKCAGFVHRKFSKHYKIVDENVISKLPRRFSKNKDA
ncbi:reticulon-like protein B16 isoform X1 [Zingiber officinale]|uniref:reticulon-like protein B16 isoform X1 n=1 Tax=Zingiber officinale TaxID=94328 RepID=UPI001C4B716C|nr:reticulon-like protein B16 isoform X1 [Zingiber officinale]